MQITLMKGKIHRAQVTLADLHYEGSISIDRALIDAAGFIVNERFDIYNIDTGARFSTYVIEAPPNSGMIGLNGAAARLAMIGDKLIIVSYANFEPSRRKASTRAWSWLTIGTGKCRAPWSLGAASIDKLPSRIPPLEDTHIFPT
jgi:aspartate 1-decarboxylase